MWHCMLALLALGILGCHQQYPTRSDPDDVLAQIRMAFPDRVCMGRIAPDGVTYLWMCSPSNAMAPFDRSVPNKPQGPVIAPPTTEPPK